MLDVSSALTNSKGGRVAVFPAAARWYLPAARASRIAAFCSRTAGNVGRAVFEAVLPLLNNFARVPVCGLIAHYNNFGKKIIRVSADSTPR
jgi:hypothetical protein